MAKSTAKTVIQRSRRGAGEDDWGRIDVKVVCGIVTAAKAEHLEGLIDAAIDELQEDITGQKPMFGPNGKPTPEAKGQKVLPLGKKTDKAVATPPTSGKK